MFEHTSSDIVHKHRHLRQPFCLQKAQHADRVAGNDHHSMLKYDGVLPLVGLILQYTQPDAYLVLIHCNKYIGYPNVYVDMLPLTI